MSPPPSPSPSNPHTLPSTFHHANWTIKYSLTQPTSPPPQNNPIPTLIFIHGTPWSSAVFQPLAQTLSSTHRILLYDLPGYGQSQHLDAAQTTTTFRNFDGNTSIKHQASALAALLAHLQLDGNEGSSPNSSYAAPAVLAHDIAGLIALRAHLLHGMPFSRIMLLDTNCVLPWGDGFYKLVRDEPGVFARLPGRIFGSVVREVVRSASVNGFEGEEGKEWVDELAGVWLGEGGSGQESFVRQIAQSNDADVQEMLDQSLYAQVRCQVTVLWGDGDTWIPRNKMEELCELLGERLERFVVVEGAGHLVMLDQPGKVEEEVKRWLE